MRKFLSAVSIIVPDYDDAIAWYTETLGFQLIDDIDLGAKRWVTLLPSDAAETQIVLAKPSNDDQASFIGEQGGGRVWLFLQTDDFDADYARMTANGVAFLEQPREEAYGKVVVFEDKFGNKWDLIQRY